MTELCMLALVLLGIALAALLSVHFYKLGQESMQKTIYYVPMEVTPSFVQRIPGQETTYVEEFPDNIVYLNQEGGQVW